MWGSRGPTCDTRVGKDVSEAPRSHSHHRQAGGHGFQGHEAQGLTLTGHHEHVPTGIGSRELIPTQLALKHKNTSRHTLDGDEGDNTVLGTLAGTHLQVSLCVQTPSIDASKTTFLTSHFAKHVSVCSCT